MGKPSEIKILEGMVSVATVDQAGLFLVRPGAGGPGDHGKHDPTKNLAWENLMCLTGENDHYGGSNYPYLYYPSVTSHPAFLTRSHAELNVKKGVFPEEGVALLQRSFLGLMEEIFGAPPHDSRSETESFFGGVYGLMALGRIGTENGADWDVSKLSKSNGRVIMIM